MSRSVASCQKTPHPTIARAIQTFPPEEKTREDFLLKKKKKWKKTVSQFILNNSLHGPWEVLKGSPEAMIQNEITVFFKSEIALNQLSSMNQRDTVPTHP